MAGAFALIVAGLGSAVLGNSADGDTLRADYQTISATYTGSEQAAAAGDVDISRSMDRAQIANFKKQTEDQAAQKVISDKQRSANAENYGAFLEKNQWVLPVAGYHLTARFGQRSGLWSSGIHTGLDFAGPSGTTIVSVAAGTVKSAGYEGAYGNRTVVTLEDGTDIWYCHQSRITVGVGQKVDPGEIIGYTGSTGNVTGPHLHLEVHPDGGSPVDPYSTLTRHDVFP